MYNTPIIRNGGFGALQVEALTNRPLSIARRHLAASQLRMRDIEPDELSSSEWVRFLVMEEMERDRWMSHFVRKRRNSDESTSSAASTAQTKAEEAGVRTEAPGGPETAANASRSTGSTPAVSLWVRELDREQDNGNNEFTARRTMHARRAITTADFEAPPAYNTVTRTSTPPPAYEPRRHQVAP